MSVCPEHGVERVLSSGHLRCLVHRAVSQAHYLGSSKNKAKNARSQARYSARPDDRRNTLAALRRVKARLAQKRVLMHELQSQLAELEVPA